MKTYTDLEQSKKLAKILPIESADMFYSVNSLYDEIEEEWGVNIGKMPKLRAIYRKYCPCWSLAALLEIIPYRLNDGSDFIMEKWDNGYLVTYSASCHKYGNELVDACYEMILNLHEQKLLNYKL